MIGWPEKIHALARCKYAPATFEKRFAREMAGWLPSPVTGKQSRLIDVMCHRYRKQIGRWLMHGRDNCKEKMERPGAHYIFNR